ncbi:AAA family ATPase [Pseudarthrobacter sp. lyk4-40-TYG-27]|uniref:AAA family ATPase n=1 Tax=Pseudarthrobacter sp. lyk4-40-TYG-27 TaxID=3040305 RepID=UPI0025548B06|nr:AAA family ATPase [Pseudarthrobacter sp. lyk4-40-TYG-27]
MTKLISFEITGLAGNRGAQKAVFDKHINVFWGLNGSGKTSLLRILDSALSNDPSAISDVAFSEATVVFLSEKHGATIERKLTSDSLDYDDDEESVKANPRVLKNLHSQRSWGDETSISAGSSQTKRLWSSRMIEGDPDTNIAGSFKRKYLPITRLNDLQVRRYSGRLTAAPLGSDIEEFDFENDIENAWRIFNSSSLSQIRGIQQRGLADILNALFQTSDENSTSGKQGQHDADEAYRLVFDFLGIQNMPLDIGRKEFSEKYLEQKRLQSVVERIRLVNDEIAQITKSQRAFQEIINSLYSGDKRIIFNTNSTIEFRAGRKRVELNRLSSGEKQLLRILLTTLSGETSPVLIDEPELSMHVDWQQRLVGCMQEINPECQLVLATHSPEIIAAVDPRHVTEL